MSGVIIITSHIMCVFCAGFSAIYWPYDWRLVYITCCDVTKTLPFVSTQ